MTKQKELGFRKKLRLPTATATNLGNSLNGKVVLYLDDLANPKNGVNLVPKPLYYQNVSRNNKKMRSIRKPLFYFEKLKFWDVIIFASYILLTIELCFFLRLAKVKRKIRVLHFML
ncbi:hypothetical protein C8P67_10315 [Flavobacterium aquicola]|uniref:Uncharacterized protein n=1 Tax=Flavobacterium aquicola TaxID=1682742 RepID=A0A3E0EP82_9FLAO|nr:hypothetical protein C8P67_10315 [Flavobacterium aquicola]